MIIYYIDLGGFCRLALNVKTDFQYKRKSSVVVFWKCDSYKSIAFHYTHTMSRNNVRQLLTEDNGKWSCNIVDYLKLNISTTGCPAQ